MNYLRCLYREGDKVTRGSEVEVTFEIPVTLAIEFLRGSHVEVNFLWWTWFYCPKLFPLNSQSQKSTLKPQSYQRILSLHIARETHVKPFHTDGLQ